MFISRIQAIPCKRVDGIAWYRIKDVCCALQVRQDKASKLVDKADKYREYVYRPGFRSYHAYYINRRGVESIITRYCGQFGGHTRGELMSALPP